MKRSKAEYSYYDTSLGKFDAEVCEECGEAFFTEEASDKIDALAREKGLWGMERRTKISYSGNSLIVRIPKDIAEFMNLVKGEDITIHPEGKGKLVVEIDSN